MDLDPHQKTILSDDLGVAVSTQWLFDRLDGFAEIVDGRRFMLQYASLIHRPRRRTPKVGIGKCPDYVVRDFSNRWHVIECKGTQLNRSYRNSQLAAALMQKQVIEVRGAAKGDRLAAGVYLGNEREPSRSHLRVIDPPEVDPYVVITSSDQVVAATATHRLAISRALAQSGFDALAEELSLPLEVDALSELFTPGERGRLADSPSDRWSAALRSTELSGAGYSFEIQGQQFTGREVIVPVAGEAFHRNTGCTHIRVSQGIRSELIEGLRRGAYGKRSDIEDLGESFLQDASIRLETHGLELTLRDGDLYAARMEFLG